MAFFDFLSNLWDSLGNLAESKQAIFLIALFGVLGQGEKILSFAWNALKRIKNIFKNHKSEEGIITENTDIPSGTMTALRTNVATLEHISDKIPKYLIGFSTKEHKEAKEYVKYAIQNEIIKNPEKNLYISAGDFYSKDIDTSMSIDYRDYKLAAYWYRKAKRTSHKEARKKLKNLTFKHGTIRGKKKIVRTVYTVTVLLFGLAFFLFNLCPEFMSELPLFSNYFAEISTMYQHTMLSLAVFFTVNLIALFTGQFKYRLGLQVIFVQLIAVLVCNKFDFSWEFCMQQWSLFACYCIRTWCQGILASETSGLLPYINKINSFTQKNSDKFEYAVNSIWGFLILSFMFAVPTCITILILRLPNIAALILISLNLLLRLSFMLVNTRKAKLHETDALQTLINTVNEATPEQPALEAGNEIKAIGDGSQENITEGENQTETENKEEFVEVENNG